MKIEDAESRNKFCERVVVYLVMAVIAIAVLGTAVLPIVFAVVYGLKWLLLYPAFLAVCGLALYVLGRE